MTTQLIYFDTGRKNELRSFDFQQKFDNTLYFKRKTFNRIFCCIIHILFDSNKVYLISVGLSDRSSPNRI